MDDATRLEIQSILAEGKDLTLATLREDGWPQATTVSYASDGLTIYFGCGAASQKARNLGRDDRISLTVNLPYGDWKEIRGLSIGGRARRLTTPDETRRFADAFLGKFAAEIGQYVTDPSAALAMFAVEPEVISVLDYRKGFGHTDLVELSAA